MLCNLRICKKIPTDYVIDIKTLNTVQCQTFKDFHQINCKDLHQNKLDSSNPRMNPEWFLKDSDWLHFLYCHEVV